MDRESREATVGRMEWVEDDAPTPAAQAEIREELERVWVALGCPTASEPKARYTVGFTPTWGHEIVHYDPARGDPCPACGGKRLPPSTACLVCSASARNPRRHPMRARVARVMAERRAKGKGSTGKPGKRVAAPLKGGLG